jgi:HKD family nuclease
MLDIVWNDQETLANTLRVHIAQANRIDIATAFLNSRGLSLIEDDLQAALDRGCALRLFIGTDFYLTDPEALRWLERAFKQQGKSKLFLVGRSVKNTFHPKVYAFEGSGEITVVLGSANLTRGGLSDNREACCVFTTPLDSELHNKVDLLLSQYENSPDVKEATIPDIERYAGEYRAFHKHMRRAKKKADEEIEAIPQLDEDKLRAFLSEYWADGKEQADFQTRQVNYEKAHKLLEQLAECNIKSEAEFMSIWEKLVGGSWRLWHSGSLFRRGYEAVQNFRGVCQLVKEIQDGGSLSPREMFEIGLKYVPRIPGFGRNALTEIMNTYYPQKCAVLNKNPWTSLRYFGLSDFPEPGTFRGHHYERFNNVIDYLRNLCGFESMGRVDHFLNFVYWKVRDQI